MLKNELSIKAQHSYDVAIKIVEHREKLIKQKTAESGRSMVEILGVLAVMGVLSAGGIYGYSFAMDKYRANDIIYEVNLRQYTPTGKVADFAKELPRLKELGVDILWFMPIHPISEKNRKGELGSYYAVKDYKGFNPEYGTIDAPIARADDSTIERCIREDGEWAITHYRRLSYCKEKNVSLVELCLETGRTHQIRVHMKSIGHPIIGDFLYNPDYTYIKRQALHSASLTFVHPITKEKMHFSAPLHRDMKCIFESI